jgi:hypothetical protein
MTSETLDRANWFIGSNGNWFADIGDFRYCVTRINPSDKASGFMVARNGIEITGPRALGKPAGHKTVDGAKRYAEWHADANA